MRSALCLFGKVGNTEDKSGYSKSDPRILEISSKKYKENVTDINNCEIFLHSWDTDLEKEILNHFSPKEFLIEDQKIFDIPEYVNASGARNEKLRLQNHYSMWYSVKKSVELAIEHSKKNNFQYDIIMIGRFDQAWETKFDFLKLEKNNFYTGKMCQIFDKNNVDIFKGGKNYFYKNFLEEDINSYRHDHKHKPDSNKTSCFWFAGNQQNIENFSKLFDYLNSYKKENNSPISSHALSMQHIEKLGLKSKLLTRFHLYDDYPLIRRKYFYCKN